MNRSPTSLYAGLVTPYNLLGSFFPPIAIAPMGASLALVPQYNFFRFNGGQPYVA